MGKFWNVARALMAFGWLAVLVGCVSQPLSEAGGSGAEVPLTNTYWQLSEVAGEPVSDAGATSEVHMILRDDGVVNGFGGCNAFRGEYKVINNRKLVFSRLASTRRACLNKENPEQVLFAAMANTVGVQMVEHRLRLLDADGVAVAEFAATREP